MPLVPFLPSKVVFTGPLGPGNTLTTFTFNNVKGVNVDLFESILDITFTTGPQHEYLDISAISTFTVSIATSVATFTLS
jgi:hypothetical protein